MSGLLLQAPQEPSAIQRLNLLVTHMVIVVSELFS